MANVVKLIYKISSGRKPQLVTPCPHSFGWLRHGVWGVGAQRPVMVASSICELDCPYNCGVNRLVKICKCSAL